MGLVNKLLDLSSALRKFVIKRHILSRKLKNRERKVRIFFLLGAFFLVPAIANTEELSTLQDALDQLDGTKFQATGYIGHNPMLDRVVFSTPEWNGLDELMVFVELYVDRETFEALKACEHEGFSIKDGCSAKIIGEISMTEGLPKFLIDSVADLTPLK